MAGVYWQGTDGKTYVKADGFNGGAVTPFNYQAGNTAQADFINGLQRIEDPNQQPAVLESSTIATTPASTVSPDVALGNTLRGRIQSRGGDVDSAYGALFGGLDETVRSRDSELESQYGDQFKKASDQYSSALPEIQNSYAAIGAADSTDTSDAKTKAKVGFDDTTKTIGKNKEADKTKLGQYKNEQGAKIAADRDSAKRAISSAGETTDVDALRSLSNDLDSNLSQTNVTRATLGSDGSARQAVSALTGDNGRFDSVINALDSVIKSSMSGSVKAAAVQAVTDSAGLSEEDKKKVQQTYGNVYAEQAAL